MAVDVTVPEVGESIKEGLLAEWTRSNGDWVDLEDPLFELETDKITTSIQAQASGALKILVHEGETVQIGQVVAEIDTSAARPEAAEPKHEKSVEEPAEAARDATAKASPVEPARDPAPRLTEPAGIPQASSRLNEVSGESPAVQRLMLEHRIAPSEIGGTEQGAQITREDVLRHVEKTRKDGDPRKKDEAGSSEERQTRRPMSPLRQRVAERLVQVQQTAAILTTFNEVDMSRVMDLRTRYKETFKERNDVGLGYMSFFVKATVDALKAFPEVNAYIDGGEIVSNYYYDIGIAISTDKGLVVPVLRDADQLSMADIEKQIIEYSRRAKERTLEITDITGAVFTISNGGVFGSMLSTPIINPPGSAILGMHSITKRPVVVDDEIVIRPMMYLAMSYDHRLIDGREAVTFLKRIGENIEEPGRMMLGL